MFTDDQPLIAEWAQRSPTHLGGVVLFAVVSIRSPSWQVADLLRDIREKGEESRALWGNKGRTWAWLHSPSLPRMWRYYRSVLVKREWDDPIRHAVEGIDTFLSIPGVGMAKAGFIAQMVMGKGWCADTRNIASLGVDYAPFDHASALAISTRWGRIERYVRLGESLGGSALLWDRWCEGLAESYPDSFPSAERVSKWHVEMVEKATFEEEEGNGKILRCSPRLPRPGASPWLPG